MLKVTPLTPSIGAIISKVSLNKDLNSGTIEQIYSALIKHQVVFFRDQDISPETHLKLAESLGEIDPGHPVYPHVEGHQSIVLLKNDANNRPDTNDWHKDLTFKKNPPFASILHGVKVPKVGGDTLWASMSAAYDQLPNGWKDHLEELEAIHDMGTFRNDFYKEGGIDSVNNALKNVGSAVHKVIETHPISGLKYLNVNQSFTIILSMKVKVQVIICCNFYFSIFQNLNSKLDFTGKIIQLLFGIIALLNIMQFLTTCQNSDTCSELQL